MHHTVYIVTSDNMLGSNLKELLELYIYNVCLFNSPEKAAAALKQQVPGTLIIDEFNSGGCYNYLYAGKTRKEDNMQLLIFNADGSLKPHPLADACLALPVLPDDLLKTLDGFYTTSYKKAG